MGATCQQERQTIAWGPWAVGSKQQQCQFKKFAITVRDVISLALPDSTYSQFKWRLLDRIINKPNVNKVGSHKQKQRGVIAREVKKERRKKDDSGKLSG